MLSRLLLNPLTQPFTRRRAFLSAATLAAVPFLAPVSGLSKLVPSARAEDAPIEPDLPEALNPRAGTWSAEAFRASDAEIARLAQDPVIAGLAKGTLPKDQFLWYVAQNVTYLEHYAESFRILKAELPEEDRDLADRWIRETEETRTWTLDYYRRLSGHDWADSPWREPDDVVLDYAAHERRNVERGAAYGMAAMLPCFTMYEVIGWNVARIRVLEGNPYAEWVGAYGTPEYSETVRLAVDLADRLAAALPDDAHRVELTELYVDACVCECLLWETAAGVGASSADMIDGRERTEESDEPGSPKPGEAL